MSASVQDVSITGTEDDGRNLRACNCYRERLCSLFCMRSSQEKFQPSDTGNQSNNTKTKITLNNFCSMMKDKEDFEIFLRYRSPLRLPMLLLRKTIPSLHLFSLSLFHFRDEKKNTFSCLSFSCVLSPKQPGPCARKNTKFLVC